MKPYMIIKGTDQALNDFETKVAKALEEGYELFGDLVAKVVPNSNGKNELHLLQVVIAEDGFDEDDDDDDLDDDLDDLDDEE